MQITITIESEPGEDIGPLYDHLCYALATPTPPHRGITPGHDVSPLRDAIAETGMNGHVRIETDYISTDPAIESGHRYHVQEFSNGRPAGTGSGGDRLVGNS